MAIPYCPFFSTATNKVPCNTNCALCMSVDGNVTCSLNITAMYIVKMEKENKSKSKN